MTTSINSKYIVWVDYGSDGWSPRFKNTLGMPILTLKEAVQVAIETSYGNRVLITEVVDWEVSKVEAQVGKKILIYDTGQVYEIDFDKIYIPWFVAGRRIGKTLMVLEALMQAKEREIITSVIGDKNDTESKEKE